MDRALQPIVVRAQALGNPARKFLRAVERHGDLLLSRLETSGGISRVHLDRAAPSLSEDFDRVAAAGREPPEILTLLGTFHAIQLLHQNVTSLRRLAEGVAESSDRHAVRRMFLERAATEFSRLEAVYVRRVLRVVLPPKLRHAYVMLSVGTPSHQDDIDTAVIVEEEADRAVLERAFAVLTGQMLRYASPLDHYLAQQLGLDGFCVSPSRLFNTLRSGRPDFVVVTELLRAEPVAGSRALFHRFREEITPGYFHRPDHEDPTHEFYLRGILGETRSLLLRPPSASSVHPKDDGLRLILSLASALKTVVGVRETRLIELLRVLAKRRSSLRPHLTRLEESYVFLDTFRHLAQLLIVEEEEVAVEGTVARENLRKVASAMGYGDRGAVQAVDHLLVHYQEAVAAAHEVVPRLMEELSRHLASIARSARWIRGAPAVNLPLALASDLAAADRSFRGVRFWDDVLEAFAEPDGRLLREFCLGWRRIPEAERRDLALEFADWGRHAPFAIVTLLTLLAREERSPAPDSAAREMGAAFLDRLGTRAEEIRALSRVFRSYPDRMNRYLLTLGDEDLGHLHDVLAAPIGDLEVAAARDRFAALVEVHRGTSQYVKRVLARLTVRHPVAVLALGDATALRTLALGRLAASESHTNPEEQKRLLGDYYDLSFLRTAMGTLQGVPSGATRSTFMEITRTYLTNLFDLCLREVERETECRLPDRDLLGIFLAGGNARGRPYDDDYDLLALLDSNDPGALRVAETAVVRMNREIARRGIVVQYRLGERLGRFVTPVSDLVRLLGGRDDDLFVDRCQVLGSRMITGGRKIEEALREKVLRPLVFAEADAFAARVAREIRERRTGFRSMSEGTIHLKEVPGGLRELDLCLAASQARRAMWSAVDDEPFESLVLRDPERRPLYETLAAACRFLVAVRSVCRVCVAASDEVRQDHLDGPARILGYAPPSFPDPASGLFRDIERHVDAASRAIENLLPEIVVPAS
jgi:hypothetical protein